MGNEVEASAHRVRDRMWAVLRREILATRHGNKNYFSKRDGSSGWNPAVSRVSIAHRKALRHNPRKVVAPGPFWRAGGGERRIQRPEGASHDDEDMKGYP
jgi:hypothetical protein